MGQGNIYAELSSDSPLETCLQDHKFYQLQALVVVYDVIVLVLLLRVAVHRWRLEGLARRRIGGSVQ